jgi:phage shock protein C
METKKLYRSKSDRNVAGVCAGLGEYFNIDPVLIRIIFAVTTLAGGPGLIAYILLAIIMPEADGEEKPKIVEV